MGNELAYRETRKDHWDTIARRSDSCKGWGSIYHHRLGDIYRFLVPARQRVLELGCGTGDLLAFLNPSHGIGVDFSIEMIVRAQEKFPILQFFEADVHDLSFLEGEFDVIILSDLVNSLWDVQRVFHQINKLSHSRTRIILNTYSRLWEIPLSIAEKLNLANPLLPQNWLTVEDIQNLLHLTDFETIRSWQEILWPLPPKFLNTFCNRYLSKIWPFRLFALTNFVIARPKPMKNQSTEIPPTVSVVVAARNEAGNIQNIFERVPNMGGRTELIFVEGHSTDDTYQVIEREIKQNPNRAAKLFSQEGDGKGDAIRLGFEHSEGDILMILDADLTVPPEDLPNFYRALISGKGDFINGVRLVYPMEDQAMRYFNLIGNKFFGLAFSWLLDQPI